MALNLNEEEFLMLCERFLDESAYDLKFSKSNALLTYYGYVNTPDAEFIVIRDDDGTVQAAALVMLDYFAHTRPFGYIVKFYVLPEYRGGTIAVRLIKKCNEWFDEHGTITDFSTPLAKIGDENIALGLLKRLGYDNEASQMYREKTSN
jgi:GNAT superfamily N-acetyltransferase